MPDDKNRVLTEILNSVPGYALAREYDGLDIWEKVRTDDGRLQRTLRQVDIEYDPNFCCVVIDSRTDRMKVKSVTVADDPSATEVLSQIIETNRMDLYYPTWQRNSVRDGDGYILVWPDDEADGEEPEEDGAPALGIPPRFTPDQINITYVDPMRGRLFYNSSNPRKKDFFAQLWFEPIPGQKAVEWHMELTYPDRIEHYASPPRSPDEDSVKAEDFVPWVPGLGRLDITTDLDTIPADIWPDENPYGVVPAYPLSTDLPYGKPEARNAYGPQDAMSRLVQVQMVTVQFLGWPQLYAIQEAQNLAQQSIREDPLADAYAGDEVEEEGLTNLPGGASVTNETGTGFEFSPGAVALFKGFKDVGQFTAADPAVLLEPLREQMKIVSGTTGTPLHRFVGSGEPPSGESLKVANQPTNDRADRLKDLFGASLKDGYEFALFLCGIEDAKVEIEWAQSQQESEEERWTVAALRQAAGVPFKAAMMMAGISKEQVDEWATEREANQEKERAHAIALAQKTPVGNEKIPPGKANAQPAPVK